MQIPINLTQCNQQTFSETTDVILLVQNDTNPPLIISITNDEYNSVTGNTTTSVIDVSSANVYLKLRKVNANTTFSTIEGTKIAGLMLANGSISYTSPYDGLGVGGRVAFFWEEGSLSESGLCEGEISITYNDSTVQTVYNILPINIRPEF